MLFAIYNKQGRVVGVVDLDILPDLLGWRVFGIKPGSNVRMINVEQPNLCNYSDGRLTIQ